MNRPVPEEQQPLLSGRAVGERSLALQVPAPRPRRLQPGLVPLDQARAGLLAPFLPRVPVPRSPLPGDQYHKRCCDPKTDVPLSSPRTRRPAPMYRCRCNRTCSARPRPDVRQRRVLRRDVAAPHWLQHRDRSGEVRKHAG